MAGDLVTGDKCSGTVAGSREELSTLSCHRAIDDRDERRRCVGFLAVLRGFLQRVKYHAEEPSESDPKQGAELNQLAPEWLHR